MSASARSERTPEERPQRGSPLPSQYDARRAGAPDEQWQNRGRSGEPNESAARPKMSPDERRELRQQIDRAGRDIYPSRR